MVVNNKIHEVRIQGDLFGRLFAISMQENPDLRKILSYPITPVPMSTCQMDSTICKTPKSALLKHFKSKNSVPMPSDIDIIDGFYFLHLLKDIPQTYGKIAKLILVNLTRTRASEIHLILVNILNRQ